MPKLSKSDAIAIATFLCNRPIAIYKPGDTFYSGFFPFSGKPIACNYPRAIPYMHNATSAEILPYLD